MILLSVTNVAFGEVSAKDFSIKSTALTTSECGSSLKMVEIIFHIKNPLNKPKEAIVKFRSSFL